MQIYAHRGSSRAYPENTLAAFRHALSAGIDGIELDVHATEDGVPVVIHDRDVARTTDGTGLVDGRLFAHLRGLDAGNGERVPTLAEVLHLVADAAHVDIEIKGHGIERAVLAVLDEHPRARWAISSFEWNTLRATRALDPAAELWPLAKQSGNDLIAIAAELGAPAVALFAGVYTPECATRLRDANLGVLVWTVNDIREARRVRDLGAFGLCTDVPERIISAIRPG